MVLMQQAKIDLVGPPLLIARMGRWSHGSGVATKRAFQVRHKKSPQKERSDTDLKLFKV